MGLFKTTPAKAGGSAKKVGAVTKKSAPEKPAGIFGKSGGAARRRDEDDDVDADRSPSNKGVAGARVTSGWGGAKKLQQETTTWAKPLQIKDGEKVVIRFLDDEPYANVSVHWIERKGRKSFICIGPDCPLCARGDKPRTTYHFNIAQLTDDALLPWDLEAKARVFKQVEDAAKDPKYGPLSKHYYSFKRAGSKIDDTQYTLAVIKRVSDIEEDFPELRVPDDDELAAVKRHTSEDVMAGALPRHKLEEIGKELDGGAGIDDDD